MLLGRGRGSPGAPAGNSGAAGDRERACSGRELAEPVPGHRRGRGRGRRRRRGGRGAAGGRRRRRRRRRRPPASSSRARPRRARSSRASPRTGTAIGSPDAPVTLVEFADLQCPFCAQWATDAFPDLVEEYVRPGRLRIEFRGLAFIGPDSEKALRAALSRRRPETDSGRRSSCSSRTRAARTRAGSRTSFSTPSPRARCSTQARGATGSTRTRSTTAIEAPRTRRARPASTRRRRSCSARPAARSSACEVQSLDAEGLRPAIEAALAEAQ